MSIADGTYEVLSYKDVSMALDVSGNSAANSANVQLWSRNGSNGQKWSFASNGSYYTILDAETGKSLDVANGRAANGSNVQMYSSNGSAAQRWTVVETGTQTINGTAYPVVRIGAFSASTYVVDVAGGKTALRTNVQIYQSNNSAAQRFVLVPTEWAAEGGSKTNYAGLPAASSGTGGKEVGTALSSVSAMESGTLYPAWACSATLYQVAYRMRTRESGADWFGEWSNWMSIADGSTSWGGFGTPGQSNCEPVKVGKLQWSQDGITIDNASTYDRTDIEVAVRAWQSTWGANRVPAHGPTYTYGITTVRPVTISSVGVLLAPDGVTLAWESDATHDGNSMTFECDAWGRYSTTGAASGTATIPQRDLRRTLKAGDVVSGVLTMRTADGLTVSKAFSATLSYEGSHGGTLTLTASEHATNPTLRTLTASDADASAWLMIEEGHGTRFVKLDGQSPWTVAPPIGVPWKVYASSIGASSWASTMQTFDAIDDHGWHVTSQDLTRDLAIYHNEGGRPSANPSYARAIDSTQVLGRERPLYLPQDSTEVTWTLEGVIFGDTYAEDMALFDWAAHAGHVYYRSPYGDWQQAVITGGERAFLANGATKVSLAMQGEVW